MDETEITLIKKMKSGDEDAFTRLFHLYKNRLLRLAFLITGSYDDSEDILQETMIKCYQYRERLQDPCRFQSWIYRILTRTAWRFCKKARSESPTEIIWDENLQDQTPLPLEQIIENETNRKLYQAISTLEYRQRTVLILYYYNQLSTREIARITGSLEGTVKSRLFTARKNLKQLWKETQWHEEAAYEKQII